jgi:hypothetical protein
MRRAPASIRDPLSTRRQAAVQVTPFGFTNVQ